MASCLSVPSDGRAAQPVVDGFAETFVRDLHHGDRARAPGVESAKIAEKIARCFSEIAPSGEIHCHEGIARAGRRGRAEGKQRFAGLDAYCIEPDLRARRVM